MNGYQMQIDSYKKLLHSDRQDIDRAIITDEIISLMPFANRTEEEIRKMFDSGAFNDVCIAYCKKAMRNCEVDDQTISKVTNEIYHLFDLVLANDIIKQS